MSLAINVHHVTQVLLSDGWHEVDDGTFTIDSYEFLDGGGDDAQALHLGGNSGICATGFRFKNSNRDYTCGPLTAIYAVRSSH